VVVVVVVVVAVVAVVAAVVVVAVEAAVALIHASTRVLRRRRPATGPTTAVGIRSTRGTATLTATGSSASDAVLGEYGEGTV
jgi:hypothetical protein